MNNKTTERVSLAVKWIILLVVLLATYVPLIVVIVYSFSGVKNIGGEFGQFTFANYAKLFSDFENNELLKATKNTLVIGFVSAAIATALGTTAAVGIHYMRKKFRAVADTASQITVVNAEIVTAMAFFLLIVFVRDTVYPIKTGIWWLIITHAVITTPYVILTVSPRLKQLNPNLLEASMDLGAGPMRSLFTVMLPQLAGAMVSGFALAFTLSLDDFVVTNINSLGSGVETISTFIYGKIKRGIPIEVRALSTIFFLVVLIALIVFNVIKINKAKNNKTK